MAEMALDTCLFRMGMNCTRDGKNPEDELVGENGQTKHRKPIGYRFNKILFWVCCRGSGWSIIQQWCSHFHYLLLATCVSGRNGQKYPQKIKNPQTYLHVPEMTHGSHESCSSPLGIHSPSPKELRINSYPPHIIYNNNIYYSLIFKIFNLIPSFQPLRPLPYPTQWSLVPHTLPSWLVYTQ
jgi:hypothetical protein